MATQMTPTAPRRTSTAPNAPVRPHSRARTTSLCATRAQTPPVQTTMELAPSPVQFLAQLFPDPSSSSTSVPMTTSRAESLAPLPTKMPIPGSVAHRFTFGNVGHPDTRFKVDASRTDNVQMSQQTFDEMQNEVVKLRQQVILDECRQSTTQRAQLDHLRQHTATRNRELENKLAMTQQMYQTKLENAN